MSARRGSRVSSSGLSPREVSIAAAVVAMAGSCAGSTTTSTRPPTLARAPLASEVVAPRKAVTPVELPALHVVLDEPRFAAARERERAKDWTAAATAFDAARGTADAGVGVGIQVACARDFVSGRLRFAAGEYPEAAAAFDRAASAEACALAAHASLRASQAYARAGQAELAIARARAVPADAVVSPDAKVVVAEALAARGDRVLAVTMWRALLAAGPHGPRWVDTSVKLATALLDGVDGDPAARAAEALDVATRVVVDAPKLADASGAQAARDRAVALLRARDPKASDALDDEARQRRAQAWLDANEPSRAIADAAVVAHIGAPVPPAGPLPCKAAITRAQATAKLRGLTADAWTDAIARCAGEDALVTALFSGAKASASARRTAEAIERYDRIEALFPRHRVADDARFHAALLHKDLGDDARFEAMLLALPDDYPEGDMRGEALFRVALAHMTRGDWQGAKGPLERIVAIEPNDLRWATAGRAAYFRARASSMTGEEEDARQRYAQIVAAAPLSFYMGQAYGRLDAADHTRARDALALAIAREAPGPILTRDHAELGTPAFARARALLEVGEIEEARRELTAAHLTEPGVDPEVLWTIAASYDAAGAPELGHAFARGKLTDFLAHYPAGRWRACWEIAFPRAFDALVARSSADNAIPSPLTWAIMREESSFVADAKSPADAYGLMQLIVPTARGVARGTGLGHDEAALKRPEVSIALGAKLLAGLRASYPANRALAILAYNGGGTAVGRWLAARPDDEFDLWVEQVPYEETRGYVKRVLASEAAYAFLYAPQSMDDVLAIPLRVTRPRALATGGAAASGPGASAVSGAAR